MTTGVCQEYQAIEDRIGDLYRELNTGDYDRAEVTLHGFNIRVWETRINCVTRIHLGYKYLWESRYTKIQKRALVEWVYKCKEHS